MQAPAEPMPSMPQDPSTSKHIFHLPLIAGVQVERVSDRVCKDRAGHWIPALQTMSVKPSPGNELVKLHVGNGGRRGADVLDVARMRSLP